MDAQMIQLLQAAASLLGGVLIMVALIVLWRKTPSGWLLLALAGEVAGMLFRLLLAMDGSLLVSVPSLLLVWQAMALMMAAGLLGYALERPAIKA